MIAVPLVASKLDIVPYDKIPKDFPNKKKFMDIQARWFYTGLPEGTEFIQKPGINKNPALAALRYQMTSWDLKHEHKELLVAYLMSQWFEDIKVPEKKEA